MDIERKGEAQGEDNLKEQVSELNNILAKFERIAEAARHNIAERRQAEERLSRLASIVEYSADAIISMTLDGTITSWNHGAELLYGYYAEDTIGHDISLVIPPGRSPELRNILETIKSGKNIICYNIVNLRKDGTPIDISLTISPIKDASGSVTGISWVAQDITEHKKREIALRESEERFRATFDLAAVGIAHIDLNGRFIRVNKEFCDIHGYMPDEVTGMNFQELTYSPDVAMINEDLQKLLSGEIKTFTINKRSIRKDGSTVWVALTVSLVSMDGRPSYFIAVIRDISELKRAEEALKKAYSEMEQRVKDRTAELSRTIGELNAEIAIRKRAEEGLSAREAKLNSIFRAAPIGIGVHVNRVLKDVNKRLCDMLGYSRDELIDKSARILYPTEEDFEYVGREKYRQMAKYGIGTVETRWKRKDGEIINIILSSSPVRPGDLSEITFTALDITERKRAEMELEDAKAQAELYIDLMGHDINNMNQVILGFLELANDKLESQGWLGIEDRQLLVNSMEAVRNSSRLIDNVKKLQKERAGALLPRVTDINRILVEVKDIHSYVLGRDIVINYKPGAECKAMANELLKDVFMNIVGNSIKHSMGPLVINIDLSKFEGPEGTFCRVAIDDTGPGIPDERKQSIFERGIKDEAKKAGKGLGLYLVKTLVDDFRGKIWVEDRVPGDYTKGVRVVVMLPAVE